jgi:excisionase family DNA binding protein
MRSALRPIYDARVMRRNLLDVIQAAQLLELAPSEVRRLVASQVIPFVMVGPFVRFEQSILETWRDRLASVELRDGRAIDLTTGPSEPAARTGASRNS